MKALDWFLLERKRIAPGQSFALYADPPSIDVQALCAVIDQLEKRVKALEKLPRASDPE